MATIQLKRSSTAGATPSAGSLSAGELAVNTADGKLFAKRDDGTVLDITGGTPGVQTLTDAATISWAVGVYQTSTVTLGGNRVLANPTGLVAGGYYTLIVKQDATGGRTLSYGTAFKWAGGTAFVLSTAANAIDVLNFIYDGTNLYGVGQKAFA